MPSYDRDPRVRREGKGYVVTAGGTEYRVLHSGLGWALYTGPNLDLVMTRGRPAAGYRDADAAIAAVLDGGGRQ